MEIGESFIQMIKRVNIFFGCLVFGIGLISSCSASSDTVLQEGDMISTSQPGLSEREQELNGIIEGDWVETLGISDTVYWKFSKGDVKWRGFTQNYLISHDTLFIAGSPYRVELEHESALYLYSLNSEEKVVLRRKRLLN